MTSILVLSAHPDDECFMGGTIAFQRLGKEKWEEFWRDRK